MALAILSFGVAAFPFVRETLHLGVLLIVIVLGMAVRSFFALPRVLNPGLGVAKGAVLRWAVAGLGFKLSLAELVKIGVPALLVILISTIVALWAGYAIARAMGVEEDLAILLGIGGGICGASAIIAADSVLQSKRGQVACGLGIITLWGTVGILVLPWIAKALALTPFAFGIWNGASLHEMAQVVAAGQAFGAEAVVPSTVSKLARICLLAPVVVGLSWWLARRKREAAEANVAPVPWFLVAFLVFAALNSLNVLPKQTVDAILQIDLWLLCIGMAGVGLQSGFQDVRREGWAPVVAAFVQWVLLLGFSLLLVRAFVG